MAQLRQDYGRLAACGAEVVVVGPEGPEAFELYWRREQFAFIGLADPLEKASRLFSDGADERAPFARPPDWVLIDRNGRVRHVQYRSRATDSPNEDLLRMLDRLNRTP